jgi:NTE family protein
LDEMPSKVAFIHLRGGLPPKNAWLKRCTEGSKPKAMPGKSEPAVKTRYDIPVKVQDHLSRIRTDLDSFSNIEAYSLMYDAYKMTRREVTASVRDFSQFSPTEVKCDSERDSECDRWCFLAIKPAFEQCPDRFLRHLEVGKYRAFKIFRLFRRTANTIGFVLLAALAYWLFGRPEIRNARWPNELIDGLCIWIKGKVPETVGGVGLFLVPVILLALLAQFYPRLASRFRFVRSLRTPAQFISRLITRAVVPALVGWLIARIHLWIFDPLFKAAGRVKTLKLKETEPRTETRD